MQHNSIYPSAPPAEAINCNPALVVEPMYRNPPPPYFSVVADQQDLKVNDPNSESAYTHYPAHYQPYMNEPPVAVAPAAIPVQKSPTTRRSCCCIISTLTILVVIFVLLFFVLNKKYDWWD